jgi:hypothetical protein
LTTYVGNSSKETSKYGNIILKRAIVDMFLLEHRVQDSDTDETKSLKESHIPTYRNFRLPDRLIFENPVLFLTSRLKFFLLHANVFARGHDGINDVRDNVNKIYPQTQTVFDYVLSNHLIPEKQGYPDTKLFKLSKNLRNNKSLIGRITWSFLPSLLLLAVVVMLYPFFPASASVAFLFLSVVPPVFFLAANGSPIYYLAVHYGGILILPFMIFEFQYRRQQFKKKVL